VIGLIVDFRYHVATLVGIFVALGLGILIGILLTGDKDMIDQQFQLTEELRGQLKGLRGENSLLKEEMNQYIQHLSILEETFWEAGAAVVANRLGGQRLAVVILGESTLWPVVERGIVAAGGEVVTVLQVAPVWSVSVEDHAQRVYTALTTGKGAEGIEVGRFQGTFDLLVVLLAIEPGEKTYWLGLQRELAKQFKTLNIPVVVASPSGAGSEYREAWGDVPVVFLEGADSLLGQLALVYAVQQREPVSLSLQEAAKVAQKMLADLLAGP